MNERTLCIIKPDAVGKNLAGKILAHIQEAGLRPVALRMLRLTQAQAEGFYAVHRERPFFADLVRFMTSGPVIAAVLEGEDAIQRYRKLMGATDPGKAEAGTLRKLYAASTQSNAVHGSDAPETARVEVAYFFSSIDQVG
ncbi:MAG TPA: nucleoside-diphosphate kinase [Myxococcota bacterium]|nr:nucleoside-diphosphate kinase [Myxococcota bacterium]HRY96517.1 nucleoside-diphosphate kinase [Myxococcota bacterium]